MNLGILSVHTSSTATRICRCNKIMPENARRSLGGNAAIFSDTSTTSTASTTKSAIRRKRKLRLLVDRKTGWRYYREPRGNPPAASSSSTSQWPTSQWQTSWSSWQPTSSEKCWWLRFPGKNSRSDGAWWTGHPLTKHICGAQSVHKRGTHTTRLAQVTRIAVSSLCAWKESSHLVSHMSHPLLLSHLPFTSSTSSSSFTLPSTTTQEHAAQPVQHGHLQEHPVHHAHLQALPVDKQRHQESLWRENLQSGGNPRTTAPTETISSWSYDMEGHAKKCVARYCELAKKTTQQWNKVATPCMDDHQFKEERMSE